MIPLFHKLSNNQTLKSHNHHNHLTGFQSRGFRLALVKNSTIHLTLLYSKLKPSLVVVLNPFAVRFSSELKMVVCVRGLHCSSEKAGLAMKTTVNYSKDIHSKKVNPIFCK